VPADVAQCPQLDGLLVAGVQPLEQREPSSLRVSEG
jgi:hypothetical protein